MILSFVARKAGEQPNAGIDRRERAAFNIIFRKIDERHAIERPCPMTCWAAHKWNEPLSLCLSTKGGAS
jgi:hypothetical protein